MADIDIERKGPSIWPWIIGLLILALLVWGLVEMMGDDEDEVDADEAAVVEEPLEPAPPPVTTAPAAAMLPVAAILAGPDAYVGQTVSGEARVAEVPTDRGFWVEADGQRMFAILNQNVPPEQPLDVNPGQRVRMDGARVRTDMSEVPGDLDARTRGIVEGQQAFLTVDPANLDILTEGQPQPGTDPAMSAGSDTTM